MIIFQKKIFQKKLLSQFTNQLLIQLKHHALKVKPMPANIFCKK